MCTVISYLPGSARPGAHLFGRTLDVDHTYGACVAITPRAYPFRFRLAGTLPQHDALIGAARVEDGFPLYFEAANEHGLCMAALNFPGYAAYFPPAPGRENVAPFELIPWVLAQCATAAEARALLARTNVCDLPFSDALPNTPLHWIIADAQDCFAAESTDGGLALTDNPVRVLTNSPPLPWHLTRLSEYMALTPAPPENRFAPGMTLPRVSYGMGALGLPGDLTSMSRFTRAAFLLHHSVCGDAPHAAAAQLFHLLAAVSQPRGATDMGGGALEYTVYQSCIDTQRGVYLLRAYDSLHVRAADMHAEDLSGSRVICRALEALERA